jgi:hypothetical protein
LRNSRVSDSVSIRTACQFFANTFSFHSEGNRLPNEEPTMQTEGRCSSPRVTSRFSGYKHECTLGDFALGEPANSLPIMALFIWLIIRLIQLVFSAETVFFSHEKSANSVFQPAYNSSRTAPICSTDHRPHSMKESCNISVAHQLFVSPICIFCITSHVLSKLLFLLTTSIFKDQ